MYTNSFDVALSLRLYSLLILSGILLNLRWTCVGYFSGVLRKKKLLSAIMNFVPFVKMMLYFYLQHIGYQCLQISINIFLLAKVNLVQLVPKGLMVNSKFQMSHL